MTFNIHKASRESLDRIYVKRIGSMKSVQVVDHDQISLTKADYLGIELQ